MEAKSAKIRPIGCVCCCPTAAGASKEKQDLGAQGWRVLPRNVRGRGARSVKAPRGAASCSYKLWSVKISRNAAKIVSTRRVCKPWFPNRGWRVVTKQRLN